MVGGSYLLCGNGNDVVHWQAVYGGMDVSGLLDRLLTKRPLMFMKDCDEYLLRDGTQGSNGCAAFDAIGTDREQAQRSGQ